MPVVRIESSKKHGGELPIDDIFVDSHAGAYAATRFLIGRGHKRDGMIAAWNRPPRRLGCRKAQTWPVRHGRSHFLGKHGSD